MARSDDEAVGSQSSVPRAGSDTARRSVGSMTTTGFCARRTLSLVAAAALAVPVIGISAPAAEAASWVCAYTYNAGHTVGKACFKGNTPRSATCARTGVVCTARSASGRSGSARSRTPTGRRRPAHTARTATLWCPRRRTTGPRSAWRLAKRSSTGAEPARPGATTGTGGMAGDRGMR